MKTLINLDEVKNCTLKARNATDNKGAYSLIINYKDGGFENLIFSEYEKAEALLNGIQRGLRNSIILEHDGQR